MGSTGWLESKRALVTGATKGNGLDAFLCGPGSGYVSATSLVRDGG